MAESMGLLTGNKWKKPNETTEIWLKMKRPKITNEKTK